MDYFAAVGVITADTCISASRCPEIHSSASTSLDGCAVGELSVAESTIKPLARS